MEIKKIKTNKFKTNLCALFLTVPLTKETVSKNALLVSVLRRGCKRLKTQEEISKHLENMYGAGFNCGVDKMGNYHILKFYLETIDNSYTLEKENLLQQAVDLLLDIVFEPLVKDEMFNKEYVKQEKDNLTKMLKSRQDNKAMYSKDRCIEEMFENEPYGLFKYGNIEELEKIDEKNLYQHYKNLLKICKINLFISGENIDDIKITDIEDKKIEKLEIEHKKHNPIKDVKENLDVTQGKLIIGLNTPNIDKEKVAMYNTILGGGANSKLFQNVREKASLAYSAGSSYIKRQNVILIQTGIEIQNFDKTLEIIKRQLEEMKKGNITDTEFDSAKQLMLSGISGIKESAEDIIAFEFDKNIFNENETIDEYLEKIKNITKEDVVEVAQNIEIDTIYFLKREA